MSDFSGENPMRSLACVLVCLFATLMAHAQGVGSSGEITGTVTDSSGAVLPGVTVNVVDTADRFEAHGNDERITGQFRASWAVAGHLRRQCGTPGLRDGD